MSMKDMLEWFEIANEYRKSTNPIEVKFARDIDQCLINAYKKLNVS
jgi:hypothetical protein